MKQFIIFTLALCILGNFVVSGTAYAKADAAALCKKIAAAPDDTELLKELKTYISKTANVDEKARLAVIYCLGCLYTGQSKEANSIEAYLKQNFPADPNMEFLSPQHVRTTCQKCCGSGKMTTQCTKCRGTGKCTVCKGSGWRSVNTLLRRSDPNGPTPIKCFQCEGLGKCHACAGPGELQQICTACRGLGGPLSREKIETMYFTLAHFDPEQAAEYSSKMAAARMAEQDRLAALMAEQDRLAAIEAKKKNASRIRSRVIQATPSGLLVNAYDRPSVVASSSAGIGGGGGVYTPPDPKGKGRPRSSYGTFWLVGHPKSETIVDDDYIDVDAYEDGTHSYTTVLGSSRRVKRYVVIKTY